MTPTLCIFDLRQLNGNPNSIKFDPFWEQLGTYLEEITPPVDDGRHGEVAICPLQSQSGISGK